MSTQKAQRQPMSDNRKKLIIIIAIILAAVIAVSVTLIVLLQPQDRKPDDENPGNSQSSNLPVKNGDFALVGSEDTTFPKSALNWNRYTYKEPSGNTHDFEVIDTNTNVVMGIVDTDDEKWKTVIEDLKLENITLTEADNPKQHSFLGQNEKHENSNVYMIATKTATNALIMSDSVSVSATTSVKITVRVNTSQLKEGSATIMIQNSSSTPNAKEENRYAYKYEIPKQDNWQQFEFYVFNRKTSTQYIRVSIGLGNSYDETIENRDAQGVMYIDDIAYETVTANDYRLKADEAEEGDTSYKIIEKEEATTVAQTSEYLTLKNIDDTEKTIDFATSESYVDETKTADDANGYSPFTVKDDFTKAEDSTVVGDFGIYKLTNDGSTKTPVALQLSKTIELKLDEEDDSKQDYAHISFWVRTVSQNNNALAFANILVQRQNEDKKWESLSSGDFTAKTEQNIKTDTNNGWAKYDIYLKPAQKTATVRIVFALGSAKGYEGTDFAPQGSLYVTTPYYETISSSAYTSASGTTASKKFDLAGSTAETTVTNGSFSTISANTNYPSNWTPAFAGQNIIYKDGQPDKEIEGLSTKSEAVAGSGVVDNTDSDYIDDDANKILKLTSHKTADNKLSSFGMISNNITATAHTVYVFSVLAKSDNAQPYFYLLETGVARDKTVVGKVENIYSTEINGEMFCQTDAAYKDTGWIRYYIVYVTGDKDTTVKLALFNGSIDGSQPAADGATVYYDKVTMQTIGTYSMVEDEDNKDATQYKVSFTAAEGYTAFEECKDIAAVIKTVNDASNYQIAIDQPTSDEWTEMQKIPEETNDDDDDNTDNETETKRDVNLALLFSILSSVLLVAALAVVVVIKIFKRRKNA